MKQRGIKCFSWLHVLAAVGIAVVVVMNVLARHWLLDKPPARSVPSETLNSARSQASSIMVPATRLSDSHEGVAEDPRATIGRAIFFDPDLSEPPGTSCANCHSPEHGYAGVNGSSVGVPRGSKTGHFARRNSLSVMYLRFVRPFHLSWEEESDVPEASGGFFWDGRVSSIAQLALQPLLHVDEMGNRDVRQVAKKVARARYAEALRREFDGALDSPAKAVEALGLCIEAFLISRAMSPFSSKYDDFVRGRIALEPKETRGLKLFQDADKGGCSACHRLDPSSGLPESSMFTDYGYDVVAVPRNHRLLDNAQGRHFDLGVCERRDAKYHTEDAWFCGAFRTPSLRNVAVRESFMHNGVFASLKQVVEFYATRSTDPEHWYPSGKFDDLPEKFHTNVNTTLPPYNRPKGEPPALDAEEVDAIVAFLGTLTDRDVVRAPSAPEDLKRLDTK